MLDKLEAVSAGLNRRFPNGNEPFQMMTRLLEECGELAQQVNHFEKSGIKLEKYGEPSKQKMAKEVMDVLRCTIQVVQFYGIEQELEETINQAYERLKSEGFID